VQERDGITADGSDPAVDRAATPFRPAPEPGFAGDRDVCPFLAAEGPGGTLDEAIRRPDPANRCISLGEPQPQSDRQQELVCLTGSHVNCPRYLRGVLLAGVPPPKPVRQPISAVVVGSALVLAAALAASFGFLVVRGGFNLQIASPNPALLAAAATPSPAASPRLQPTEPPSPSLSPSPSAAATPSLAPTPAPTATPSLTPTARPTPTPAPSSNRYALLTRCPSTPNCWIYTVRAGDNLRSIANYFGVAYDTVLRMNPQITDPTAIRAGDEVKLPPPTR
jgi:hypothetical protein